MALKKDAKKEKKAVSVEDLERAISEVEALTGSDSGEVSEDEDEVDLDFEAAGEEAENEDESDESEEETQEAASDEDEADEDEAEEEEQPAKVAKSAHGKKVMKKALKRKAVKPAAKEEDEDEDGEDDMQRSLGDELYGEEPVMKAVDISPFIESLVEKNAEILDELAGEIRGSREQNSEIMKAFSKAFRGIAESITDIGNRVSSLENAPAKPKGVVKVLERSLGTETTPAKKELQLNKAQVADALEALHGKGEVQEFDVIRFETSNFLTPQVQKKVIDFWSNGAAH